MTQKTFGPYSDRMAKQMRLRAYDVEVTFPNGQVKSFPSMAALKEATGIDRPDIRAGAVWFEMELGEVARVNWKDLRNGGTYQFAFTRRC
ncbi:hypothetical protein VPZ60_004323 [Salmonella enterica]|nr:hypothetical protein [Salmonella enterica]